MLSLLLKSPTKRSKVIPATTETETSILLSPTYNLKKQLTHVSTMIQIQQTQQIHHNESEPEPDPVCNNIQKETTACLQEVTILASLSQMHPNLRNLLSISWTFNSNVIELYFEKVEGVNLKELIGNWNSELYSGNEYTERIERLCFISYQLLSVLHYLSIYKLCPNDVVVSMNTWTLKITNYHAFKTYDEEDVLVNWMKSTTELFLGKSNSNYFAPLTDTMHTFTSQQVLEYVKKICWYNPTTDFTELYTTITRYNFNGNDIIRLNRKNFLELQGNLDIETVWYKIDKDLKRYSMPLELEMLYQQCDAILENPNTTSRLQKCNSLIQQLLHQLGIIIHSQYPFPCLHMTDTKKQQKRLLYYNLTLLYLRENEVVMAQEMINRCY